jgi:hypothetical protein
MLESWTGCPASAEVPYRRNQFHENHKNATTPGKPAALISEMNLDQFFMGYEETRPIFEALRSAIDDFGQVEVRVSKSQVAFKRDKAFAWAWIPGRYLKGRTAPLVLSLSFASRNESPRWKEIVEPARGRFTHHLELWSTADIDGQVRGWLEEAWQSAG